MKYSFSGKVTRTTEDDSVSAPKGEKRLEPANYEAVRVMTLSVGTAVTKAPVGKCQNMQIAIVDLQPLLDRLNSASLHHKTKPLMYLVSFFSSN